MDVEREYRHASSALAMTMASWLARHGTDDDKSGTFSPAGDVTPRQDVLDGVRREGHGDIVTKWTLARDRFLDSITPHGFAGGTAEVRLSQFDDGAIGVSAVDIDALPMWQAMQVREQLAMDDRFHQSANGDWKLRDTSLFPGGHSFAAILRPSTAWVTAHYR